MRGGLRRSARAQARGAAIVLKSASHPPRLRWTAAGFLALLAAPGSARLAFDGLPFTDTIEVVALGAVIAVLMHRDTRSTLIRFVGKRARATNIALVALIVCKVLGFVAVPYGGGFEACYRGLWEPRPGVLCEASWNQLWLRNVEKQLALGQISRIDKVIDFGGPPNKLDAFEGGRLSNWNLPFANEFPRYQMPWIDRLPFFAEYAGIIDMERDGVVPIEYVGDLKLGGARTFTGSASELRTVAFVPLAQGRNPLRLALTFRDDSDATNVPNVAPLARGPYARLHVGEPLDINTGKLRLVIRGWAVDPLARSPVRRWNLWHRDELGRRIDTTYEVVDRIDVSRAFGIDSWRSSGFNISVALPRDPLRHPTYHLQAVLSDGRTIDVGAVAARTPGQQVWESPEIRPTGPAVAKSDVRATYQLASVGAPLRAGTPQQPNLAQLAMLRLVDVVQLAGLVVIGFVALGGLVRRRRAMFTAALVIFGGLAATRVVSSTGALDGATSKALGFGVVVAIAGSRHLRSRGLLATALGTVLMFGPVIEVLRRYTNLDSHPWWGMQIFRDRVTDWLVFQGYARSILLESSLRGGENIFYFMPGMRYVTFVMHLMFGENDVFIGVVTGVGLVSAGLWLTFRVLALVSGRHWWWGLLAATAVVSGVGRPISRELAAYGASEAVAWTLVFSSCVVLVRRNPDGPAWVAAAAGLAGAALLRPNLSVALAVIALVVALSRMTLSRSVSTRLTDGAAVVVAFLGVGSLALLHNLWYGQQAVVFTLRADPRQTDFPVGDLWRIFVDTDIRAIAWSKVKLLLHIGGPLDVSGVFASRIAVVLWISAVVAVTRRREGRLLAATLLTAPIAYIVSTFPFGIMDTPERQIASLTVFLIASALGAVAIAQRGAAVTSAEDSAG